jgi:hypothetical protein
MEADGAWRSRKGEWMADREAAHRVAVANTLRWADEAASRSDFSDALAWLHVLDVIGDELPPEYQAKRRAWRQSRAAGCSPLGGARDGARQP